MPANASLLRNIARCCFLRIKRALPFGFFISLSLMIIVITFYAMNQNHTQLNVIKERLKGGHGLGPESYNMMKLEKELILRNHQEQHRPVSLAMLHFQRAK